MHTHVKQLNSSHCVCHLQYCTASIYT